jgi:hypothetical protein
MIPNLTPHQARQISLAHAINFVRNHQPTLPDANDIVETAAEFERYLRDGEHRQNDEPQEGAV